MPDPFETLGLEANFELDSKTLDARHRALSAALHPDRYAGKPAAERRMALDKAIAVNTAWRALKDPVRRAESLMERAGVAVGELEEPQAPPALLMEMMEAGEQLSEARHAKDVARVTALSDEMQDRERAVLAQLGRRFSACDGGAPDAATLLPLLGELRYIRRFLEEVAAAEEQLFG